MTTMYVSHGSPMIAIEPNSLTKALENWAAKHPKPDLIIVISAYWITQKLTINTSLNHHTMYDFGGFPSALYEVKYEPPGAPEELEKIQNILGSQVETDSKRGLDHGVWTVLKWLYPKADVPLFQVSLEAGLNLKERFEMGQKLGQYPGNILFIASGSLTHNLGLMDFHKHAKPANWAVKFDAIMKKAIETKDWDTIINIDKIGDLFWQAHPSVEHYVPLLYAAGAISQTNSKVEWLYEEIEYGTASMRSAVWTN